MYHVWNVLECEIEYSGSLEQCTAWCIGFVACDNLQSNKTTKRPTHTLSQDNQRIFCWNEGDVRYEVIAGDDCM